MQNSQRGVTITGLIMVLFVLILLGLFALKLIPSFLEFNKAQTAIKSIAADRSKTSSVNEVRRAFENRSAIDDITAVKATDLEVGKDGDGVVITFAYRKEIPLFANVGLFIDFNGSSRAN